MTRDTAYRQAKRYNENILKNKTTPQLVYKVKKKNYSGYVIEPIPVLNLFVLDSMKISNDFISGFKKSFIKKYTSNGYKKWANI